ncbi:TetR/AcrR family transcriptional regulator [Terrimonas sp. NA20]|uniref:TetR/AcrR family transcriptional regulator n=1 Tax=Terrimonas ginsenosidimutans TaxID=2908004 RepID=A0ABS9KU87_9BACT|nr:TetR/AcrR family transcriptional regulator [Terrimonas ginsenosidimutans]MCG2615850.1 TetR/AcrR family transcriptional regulator [Terrimonas ginsenosidimutans]
MGIAERRLRQKDEVRSSILETAWNIVREEGWQSLSIRKIADAIEYSVPVIYDHFANKEAILLEFGKQGFNLLASKMEEAKKTTEEPGEQLKAMADAYWNFAFRNKEYYQLMFGLGIACCETDKCLPGTITFRDLVMEPISRLLAENTNKQINGCLKYHTFWSVMHGLISIKMTANTAEVADELNKMVLDDAIDGFIRNLKG